MSAGSQAQVLLMHTWASTSPTELPFYSTGRLFQGLNRAFLNENLILMPVKCESYSIYSKNQQSVLLMVVTGERSQNRHQLSSKHEWIKSVHTMFRTWLILEGLPSLGFSSSQKLFGMADLQTDLPYLTIRPAYA